MHPRHVLTLVAVGLGFGQLALLWWMERNLPQARVKVIAGAVFLAYLGVVAWLARRAQQACERN